MKIIGQSIRYKDKDYVQKQILSENKIRLNLNFITKLTWWV